MLVSSLCVTAQRLPDCGERPAIFDLPRTSGLFWCPEQVTAGDEAFLYMALAVDDTGRLYAANPVRGEVVAFRDVLYDDLLPDTPDVLLDNLQSPAALHWYDSGSDSALYIAGDGVLYRWQKNTDTLQILRDDLPAGRGSLLRGLTVHDDRVYLGIPAPCERCVPDDDLAGTVVSVALDGSDLQVEARGLRYPVGLAYHDGLLWVTDTTRFNMNNHVPDELNQIDLSADEIPHFGWPYCVGQTNQQDGKDNFNCTQATAPAYVLQSGSVPIALEPYLSELFPHLTGELLLLLAGQADSALIRGYYLLSIETWHTDETTVFEALLPLDMSLQDVDRVTYDNDVPYVSRYTNFLNRRGAGFWPLHPYDVVVSPAGWIYLSSGSNIYALRPSYRTEILCQRTVCQEHSD